MKINYSDIGNPKKGIVYILYISLEYKDEVYEVTKIGVTTRNIEDRVQEILVSIWKCTRVFPRLYVKRYKTVPNPYDIETRLLELHKEYAMDLDVRFSGSTECFMLENKLRDRLINTYESMVLKERVKNMDTKGIKKCSKCGDYEVNAIRSDGQVVFVCENNCKDK